jgi:hypothetical protein
VSSELGWTLEAPSCPPTSSSDPLQYKVAQCSQGKSPMPKSMTCITRKNMYKAVMLEYACVNHFRDKEIMKLLFCLYDFKTI